MSKKKTKNYSTPASSGDERQRSKKDEKDDSKKRNPNLLNRIFVFSLVAAGLFFLLFLIISICLQEISTFWGFLSDAIINVFCGGLVCDAIVAFLVSRRLKGQAGWCMAIGVPIICLLIFISGIFEVFSVYTKEEEVASKGISKTQYQGGYSGYDGTVGTGTIYYIHPYDFEEDPFLKESQKYIGDRSELLSAAEMNQKMADIILADMAEYEIKKTTESDAYVTCVLDADLQYITYKYQRDRDWYEEVSDYIVNQRIVDLQSAIELRIEGDDDYEDAENRRLIAVYYKDLGDEYAKKNDSINAADCFEESVMWAMKSMYSAYEEGNNFKTKAIYEVLDSAANALNNLAEIGSKRKDVINGCRDVYKVIYEHLYNV